jgi:gliding motility-associated-like protein
MMKMKKLALLTTLLLATQLQAQYTIADGTVSACSGSLLDSGGEGAGGYQNNENFTTTICPDGSGGPAISLQFFTFNLSTAGSAPGDVLYIYDGADLSAPLLGQWSGSDSPGIVSASFSNPTGCLTLVFVSNETGTGVFASLISCVVPCQPPTAAATFGSPVPLLACQGEVITFDGSGSTAVDPFTIAEYRWDFADGALDSTGAVVTHSFAEPGEYVVQLTVTDDNGCSNTNLVDLQVLVSTTPVFNGTVVSPMVICEGESIDLTAVATPVMWSALPTVNLGDGVTMPDGSGVAYTSQLFYTQFAPGATLANPNDLLSICASLEHSYMGDLIISITCPSGQTMTLHQQGGGSTYLGAANDTDPGSSPVIGECWDYCWSPTATLGTFADCAAFGITPNVTQAGTPASNALIAGTYSSVQPWSTLTGCALNGTWTFTVIDNWAIDNGFICDWGLNFNPSLFPSLTQFTPVLGTSTLDSANWVGNGLVSNPNDPLSATATPVGVGTHDYVFSITDNFGCTYDTTITVTVNPAPQGPITIGGNPVICTDGVAYLTAPQGFDSYLWSPGGFTGTNVNVGAGTYTVTVAFGNCPLTSEPITVVEVPVPTPVITGPPFSCGGASATLSTTEPYASYLWSTQETSPTILAGTGSYTVTVTTAEGCSGTSAPYSVLIANNPVAGFTASPVSPQPMGTTVDFTDASTVNGGTIVSWFWDFDDQEGSSTDPNPSWTFNDPGPYDVLLIVTTADGCTDTIVQRYDIFPPDITIPNVISPNGDQMNDYFVIPNIEYWANELVIYGRWGNKVYEATNYRNQWKADDLPDGTYYYVLKLHDKSEYAGHITVLR